MLWLRFLVLSLSIVMLSARGIPLPSPVGDRLKFTVAIQGMVYCKHCKLPGYNSNFDSSPIPGATAILKCRTNRTNAVSLLVKSNKDGYFQLQTSQLTTFTSRNCRMYVPQSPLPKCNVLIYPRTKSGSNVLKFEKAITVNDGIEYIYSSDAFVFKPKNGKRCP